METSIERDFGTYSQLEDSNKNDLKIESKGLEMCFNKNLPAI